MMQLAGLGKNSGLGLFYSRVILTITNITITETGNLCKGARFAFTLPKSVWLIKEVTA